MITRRQWLATASALSVAPWATAADTPSTTWPTRPVKLVLGFPPGQGSDVAARIYSDELQKATGQTFYIDNRPGAGATLAAGIVAKAPSDGYTLLFTSSGPMSIAPHLYGNLGYDAMKDLDPIAVVGSSPLMLLVKADFPAKTLPELVALAAKRDLNAGSGGNGVTNHLALEMFKIVSGARLTHVPYKGAAPALNDLMAGQIQTMFETTSAALQYVQAGTLRALAVTSPARYDDLPGVPAMAEFYPGFSAMTWAMFAAPHGTSPVAMQRLSDLLNTIMASKSVKDRLKLQGIDIVPNTDPASAKQYAVAEFEKWGAIIAKANVRLE
ncbi:MAG: tripartite tricarboxylate transporter substrate binding protein [Rhizobacter sp.]|nr:tripartite tricarboxylate transporter substrate binding protein [Rhizobacter sp.]